MQNPQWRELYAEVQKKYSNFDTQTTQIEELFKHIKYYYPKTKSPKISNAYFRNGLSKQSHLCR